MIVFQALIVVLLYVQSAHGASLPVNLTKEVYYNNMSGHSLNNRNNTIIYSTNSTPLSIFNRKSISPETIDLSESSLEKASSTLDKSAASTLDKSAASKTISDGDTSSWGKSVSNLFSGLLSKLKPSSPDTTQQELTKDPKLSNPVKVDSHPKVQQQDSHQTIVKQPAVQEPAATGRSQQVTLVPVHQSKVTVVTVEQPIAQTHLQADQKSPSSIINVDAPKAPALPSAKENEKPSPSAEPLTSKGANMGIMAGGAVLGSEASSLQAEGGSESPAAISLGDTTSVSLPLAAPQPSDAAASASASNAENERDAKLNLAIERGNIVLGAVGVVQAVVGIVSDVLTTSYQTVTSTYTFTGTQASSLLNDPNVYVTSVQWHTVTSDIVNGALSAATTTIEIPRITAVTPVVVTSTSYVIQTITEAPSVSNGSYVFSVGSK
ncbi:hypothetical protein DASC09_031070 [Saccharomycopsis crataegensis]|uniref:Uncharacterized protein n=1 Tax=Saccharomycopsis crataegensis TaxID=43959 RepID=A0AAV5QML7_9ASCO|nr:hypothetical protein DASC09_031070 [Saccharomycopsis crataegensis]